MVAHNTLRTREEKKYISFKKKKLTTAVACLKQIKLSVSLNGRASFSSQPFSVRIMRNTVHGAKYRTIDRVKEQSLDKDICTIFAQIRNEFTFKNVIPAPETFK